MQGRLVSTTEQPLPEAWEAVERAEEYKRLEAEGGLIKNDVTVKSSPSALPGSRINYQSSSRSCRMTGVRC